MMKGLDHIVFVSKKGNFTRSVKLPHRLLVTAFITLCCVVVINVALGVMNTRDMFFEANLSRSEVENCALIRRLDSVRTLISAVHNQFDNFIAQDNRQRTFLDMAHIHPDIWLMGTGGAQHHVFSKNLSTTTSGILESIYESVDVLTSKCYLRERSLADIEDQINRKEYLWAHIPSINPAPDHSIGSRFGYRVDPINKRTIRMHWGVDIGAPRGTPIYATADGAIIYTGWNLGYGLCIDIDHGFGFRTRYAHCNSILVKVGDKITRGQMIATVGSTGRTTCPHLHYEVHVSGVKVNPAPYIDHSEVVVD